LLLGRWLFILWSFLWTSLGKEVSILQTLVSPMVRDSPLQHNPLCVEEMHDSWWFYSGIKNQGYMCGDWRSKAHWHLWSG
jgi:hypothetical protein